MKKLLLSTATVIFAAAMLYGQTEILINDFTGTLDPAKIYGDNYDTGQGGDNAATVTFEDNMLRADYSWLKPDWFPRAVWYYFDDFVDMSDLSVLELKFMVQDNDNDSIKVRFDLFGEGEEELNDTIRSNMETNGNPWEITAGNGVWYTLGSDFEADNRWYCTYYGGGIPATRVDSTQIAGFQAFANYGNNDLASQPGTLWIDYIKVRDVLTGIEEVIYGRENAFGVALYPSVTSNVLNIKAENQITRVDIFNITGKLVTSIQNINERRFEINVSELNRGMYITNIHNQKGQIVSSKFIRE
ncbi:MAG: T9SS type A sorting domain-containing protein [Bacteroidales bacterium]